MTKPVRQSNRSNGANRSKANVWLDAVRKASKATKTERVELLRRAGIVDSKGKLTKRYTGQ